MESIVGTVGIWAWSWNLDEGQLPFSVTVQVTIPCTLPCKLSLTSAGIPMSQTRVLTHVRKKLSVCFCSPLLNANRHTAESCQQTHELYPHKFIHITRAYMLRYIETDHHIYTYIYTYLRCTFPFFKRSFKPSDFPRDFHTEVNHLWNLIPFCQC